ncbi:DUF4226 domain-containing protein [Mycolicibacterium obuense]|uniref:Biofilm regulator BssS n=1 Tax=Mycolicibacterium obuense TaxID=1807 RepID=A0A0M2JWF0_9MYCO|nr:DUF4226 domain-containing protein [Mycolicibacterium obuense]KKF00920.1 Biofilm regulator BssS [Mycolicibacterium obuense]OKH70869.1 Biofilm regulator BssS [Mycobacterium sp. SWH-M1]
MTFGLPSVPDLVSDLLEPAVVNVAKVVGAVGRVFGDDDQPPSQTPLQRTNTALHGPGGAPSAPPPAPAPPADSAGGLNDGATSAGDQHTKDTTGASLTDEKLAALLKQIFASNQQARDKINAILADVQSKSKQIAPEMADPASVMAFQKFMDGKFAEIQKVLGDAQVDAKTQAAIMDALGQEYRASGPAPGEGGGTGSGTGSGSGESAGGGAGGGGGDTAPPPADDSVPSTTPAGDSGLTDPMAGMGPLGMGGMGMDPLSSLAGMGSALPGMLGGLGAGGSPLDALSGLGGLGSALPGLASQFSDKSAPDQGGDGEKFSDTKGDSKTEKSDDQFTDEPSKTDDSSVKKAEPGSPVPTEPTVQPAVNTSPEAAAPAAAPAVAPHTVPLPDGTSVTAADAQRERALKAVLNGSSVSAAYGDQIPPAGSPVMNPVDRNSLRPGDYAQFEAKPAVMYMGNGKIWLDGQLKEIRALTPSADFLGWTGPPAAGGGTQAAVPAPAPSAPASASVTTAPPTGNPTA